MRERLLRNRKLITHYYIIASVAVLFFVWAARNEEAIDPVILTILAVYVLVFPVVILYTRKYAVHIFLFLLAFITGFYSYYHYSVEAHSVLNALYFTFQLYILVVSDVFTPEGSSSIQYPLTVELARWSAASYTIATLFIAMYRTLEMSILLVFYQVVGNHTIVFGYNENSIAFIEDLRKRKKRVVLVAGHIPNEVVDYLDELKVVVLHHRNKEESIHTKCGIARAKNVVLLHDKDVDNLNELLDIRYDFLKRSKKNLELTVFIHLQEIASRKLYLDLEGTMAEGDRHFQVQLINLYESFVEDLFEKHPLYATRVEVSPVHVLIIGFGALGQQIALKTISQSDQYGKAYITAIDKSMSSIKQEWNRNYPEISEHVQFALHTFDVMSDSIDTMIKEQNRPITHIYVCLHEDYLDLWAGIELSNQFPHIPIYLEFSDGSIAEKWIQSEVSGTRLIYSTGMFKDVMTEEKLLN